MTDLSMKNMRYLTEITKAYKIVILLHVRRTVLSRSKQLRVLVREGASNGNADRDSPLEIKVSFVPGKLGGGRWLGAQPEAPPSTSTLN